ncbi:MAG: hypothetical protein LC781_00640 [Actinobacteria bacterium]|nr:hypothetical protein [Actinomycetota bacterium]
MRRLKGHEAREREAAIPSIRSDAEIERSLEIGLTATESVGDRTISTFVRTELSHSAGMSTFMGFPYVEDVREVGNYDVAISGRRWTSGGASVRVLASGRRASGVPRRTTAPTTTRWA